MECMQDIINDAIAGQNMRIEQCLEYAVRHLIRFPIKGKITRFKLWCRGIKVVREDMFGDFVNEDGNIHVSADTTLHLYQFGKQIL